MPNFKSNNNKFKSLNKDYFSQNNNFNNNNNRNYKFYLQMKKIKKIFLIKNKN